MVTVSSFEKRKNSQDEEFGVLILQGDLEIVLSKTTNKPYATIHQVSIPCTFDESTAKRMIGKHLKGEIQKVPCDEYDYTSKQTGEVVTLNHTYVYNPDPSNLAEVVIGAVPAF